MQEKILFFTKKKKKKMENILVISFVFLNDTYNYINYTY